MTPDDAIDALDRMLSENGQDAVLTRYMPGSSTIGISVNVRVKTRDYKPQELVGGITQQDQLLVMSPTQINARRWPGGTPGLKGDKRIPVKDLCKFVISKATYNVQAARGYYLNDELVRIEAQVRGP